MVLSDRPVRPDQPQGSAGEDERSLRDDGGYGSVGRIAERPTRFVGGALGVLVGVVVGLGVAPGVAGAAFTFPSGSPLSSANESFLSGFPQTCGTSVSTPNSILNDGTHIFVATLCENQKIYRFPEGGGAVGDPAVSGNTTGNANGLALDDGTYFSTGSAFCCGEVPGVYKFDPGTLTRASSPVTTGTGFQHSNAAIDPLTGDLYFGDDGTIRRIQNPASGSPTVSAFANASADDLKWTADGSRLYVGDGNNVDGFDRTGALVLQVDLSAHGVSGEIAARGIALDTSGNVFVPAADGTIVRIDVHNSNAVSTVATGGTPAAPKEPGMRHTGTGPDGCLLVPQNRAVTKFAPCIFQPDVQGKSASPPPPGPPPPGPPPPGQPPLRSSAVNVRCDFLILTSAFTCTVLVSDADPAPVVRPTGRVRFDAKGKGSFTLGNTCTLVDHFTNASGIPVTFSEDTTGCSVLYSPPAGFVPFSGPPPVKAFYLGDGKHRKSAGLDKLLNASPGTILPDGPLPDPGGPPETIKPVGGTTGAHAGGQFPPEVDVTPSTPIAGSTGVVCALPGRGVSKAAVHGAQAPDGFGDVPPDPTPPASLAQVGQDATAATQDTNSAATSVGRATRGAPSQELIQVSADANRLGGDLATARATRPDASASLVQFNPTTGHAQRPPPSAVLTQFSIDPNRASGAVDRAAAAEVRQCGGGVVGIKRPPGSAAVTQFNLPPPDVARAVRTDAGTAQATQIGPQPVPDTGGDPSTAARVTAARRRPKRAAPTLAHAARAELSSGPQTFRLRLNRKQLNKLAHGRKRITIRIYTIILVPNIFFAHGQPIATVQTITLKRTPKHHKKP